MNEQFLAQLKTRRDEVRDEAMAVLRRAESAGRKRLTDTEDRRFRKLKTEVEGLNQRIADTEHDIERAGGDVLARLRGGGGAEAAGRDWARRTANEVRKLGGESRAVVSGSFDVPTLVEPTVAGLPHTPRLIDLFSNRVTLESNAFEFFQQTARTNNATAVADGDVKPTSVLTVAPVTDRARVIAHLSEPAPIRLWQDQGSIIDWLWAEMVDGVLDAVEAQIVSGDNTGENMAGLLYYAGLSTPVVPTQAYVTDVPTTLRSALTSLQVLGEQPTGWALHPADAQSIDLLRWSTGGGFLSGGYENDHRTGFGTSDNIFGSGIPRVISPDCAR